MNVYELTQEQLNELKESLFYQFRDLDDEQPFAVVDPVLQTFQPELKHATTPETIPDNIIFAIYDGINFVNDDFFCTAGT